MIWIFLFLFLLSLVAFVFWAVSHRRKIERQISADHERLKRTDPLSPLARLGENEFHLAYGKALNKRLYSVLFWVMCSVPVTLFLPAWLIVTSDGVVQPLIGMAICIGGLAAVIGYSLAKSPPALEVMLNDMK